MTGFRRVAERTVHDGYVWSVVVATFEAPDGSTFERDVVRSPGAVAALPVRFDPEGSPIVTLVRQYRAAPDQWVVEVPAGMRDVVGEPPEETARRELVEEVGLVAGRIEPLGCILPSPGMTDAVTWLFLATELTATDRAAHGPEEHQLEVLHLPLADAVQMVLTGEITDAKTVTSLLLVERQLVAGG
jgi:ADP-ribose pyrophosphatase